MSSPSPMGLLLAALFFVLGAAVSGAVVVSTDPRWQSTAILDIDQPKVVATAQEPAVLDKLSRLRYKYVGLVATDRIAVPVAEALGEDVGQVRERLDAGAASFDLLIRVSGTSEDPEVARRTSDALAVVLAEYVDAEQEADGVAAEDRVLVEVVDVAAPAVELRPGRDAVALAAALGGTVAAVPVLLVAAAAAARAPRRRGG